jgi:hypothetical protein
MMSLRVENYYYLLNLLFLLIDISYFVFVLVSALVVWIRVDSVISLWIVEFRT